MTMDALALASIATRLRWAAGFNGVTRIQLSAADPGLDVAPLARCLDALLAAHPVASSGPDQPPARLQVHPAGDFSDLSGEAARTALVLVAPDRVRKRELDPVRDLQAITGWPLIGVISYPHRRFWQRRGRPILPDFQPATSGNPVYERFWNRRKSPNGKLASTDRNLPLSRMSEEAGTAR
jgi:hypothetical protein